MTLSEFREFFVNITGRQDLVERKEDSIEDNGADILINMGIRLLDSKFTHSKSAGKTTLMLKRDKDVYEVPSLLSIEGVQVSSDSGRVTLDHKTEDWIERYSSDDETGTGTPGFYCIYTSVRDAILGNSQSSLKNLTIKVAPKPDEALTAYVYGRVSIPLKDDEDTNFWTLNYPETLISATMYMIERFHRNSQGMNDHMRAINEDLRNLDHDAIESQLGSNTQMNDSFNFRAEGNEW